MTGPLQRPPGRLGEPLLLTKPVHVCHLCGFDSSNAALLVERDRVRLFTDFRYIDEARATAGVETVQTRRDTIGELSETLSRRVGFETTLPFEQYERLRRAGLDLVPCSGTVERLRAVKDEIELDCLRRACAITDRVFERLRDVTFVGRTELEVSWDLAGLFH